MKSTLNATPESQAHENQQTQAEKEMRDSARGIAQGDGQAAPSNGNGDGLKLFGGTWRLESKKAPDWVSKTGAYATGVAVATGLMPKDDGSSDPINNAITRGQKRSAALLAGAAAERIAEPWLQENLKYPSISYTPDPLTPEQQAMVRRNQEHKQHILDAMGKDGLYNPSYGPDAQNKTR